VTRPHHALEGKVLEVFAKLRHKGTSHFVLVLPDGSRSYIPVAWTDAVSDCANSAPLCSLVGSASDLLALRQRVDCLLRRIQAGPANNQNSSTQESQYANTPTGVVECRTSSDSASLPTTHDPTEKPSDRSLGPTHLEVGASPSHPSSNLCHRSNSSAIISKSKKRTCAARPTFTFANPRPLRCWLTASQPNANTN